MKLPHRRKFLHLAAGAAALTSALGLSFTDQAAWSQATRTIKIIVPLPAGGVGDILARLLGEHISKTRGPTVLIENRPGASAVIGTEAASRAAPDGNTLLINSDAIIINPLLRKLNYEPLTSFEPICNLVRAPSVIAVNSSSPYRTLAGLLDAARAKPGDLTLASIPASGTHIAFEALKRAANVNMTFVPYPGAAPAVNALLGEHVTSVFITYGAVAEQLEAGKLRALATSARTRIELLPDVPTVAESGYKDFELDFWFGLFAPAKTPKDTVSQLASWFTAALQVPEIKSKLVAQGVYPVATCGGDFAAYLRKLYEDYGRVIREANIKAE
jgi:tripartite-type tricarboxylate transporter receptor subunit TctC